MPSPTSKNANIYIIPPTGSAMPDFERAAGKRFREITCLEHINPSSPFHHITVKAPMVNSITGSYANGARRASWYAQYGDFGWEGRLSGKLIENDVILYRSATGTLTANQSDGTVAANTVTVTRAGVDVTASVTPPAFDGIDTGADGSITAILPTDTVGADLQVGDVLTFEVLVSSSSIGDATLTLEAQDIDLDAGMYEVMNVVKFSGAWSGIETNSNPNTSIDIKVGQTITGDFKSINSLNVGVIAYEY